ncbi:hypothetical protein [Streptomyces nigrescens]
MDTAPDAPSAASLRPSARVLHGRDRREPRGASPHSRSGPWGRRAEVRAVLRSLVAGSPVRQERRAELRDVALTVHESRGRRTAGPPEPPHHPDRV